ncbi:MAG: glycosyltransferase family 2 protein [Methanobacterium sp.]
MFFQTVLPLEIIVIDNANNLDTKKLVYKEGSKFREKQIHFEYIKNGESNSATIARNIGSRYSSGNFLLFLDDDVILENNFIECILNVFVKYPNALGVQGYIINKNINRMYDYIRSVFFLSHSQKNFNKLLPSMQDVHAYPLTKIVNCQWLMSGCTCYRKEIIQRFKFDENLYKYCSGDDADLSYRIYKEHPNTLYQTPFARLIHKNSDDGRAPKKEVIFTSQVYHTYLFYKDIPQNYSNKLIFVWSRFGYIITKILVSILKPSKNNFLTIYYLLNAYLFCFQNLKALKRGELDFYTKNLWS